MSKRNQRRLEEGSPYPLGAKWTGSGVNFAIFSQHATRVELCLFDDSGVMETERIPVYWKSGDIWHCHVPGLGVGSVYGYRVYGPYDPNNGHRFNHNKLLLDPYAKNIVGGYEWSENSYGYSFDDDRGDLSFNEQDNIKFVPKAKVTSPMMKGQVENRPKVPLQDTIIYETHVKGLTMLHPDVPEKFRGKFMGMAEPVIIDYFKRLGVTTIELLPINLIGKHLFLEERGLSNYWGYDPINYFVIDPRFGVNDIRSEFRYMVNSYHEAGLEIILDVVYNHTGEGNQLGPTWSFRGIDNKSYYGLVDGKERYYQNDSGCGNILDVNNTRVNQMVMDSLRYFVDEMGVDGFRFDLAATLIRDGKGGISSSPKFLAAIEQDPILSRVKLIAEPWDLGYAGWNTGQFPASFSEWNDNYRDAVRSFWNKKGDAGIFAGVLTGTAHLFNYNGRHTQASINFISSHDGFTLHDLVSYNHKHNEANKEDNMDGSNNNISNNYGFEGETDNVKINRIRYRQKMNFMATLLISQGIPMINGGDEFGRSINGNNNPWCQDNELSWYNWQFDEQQKSFLNFVKTIIKYRNRHPIFKRISFFKGTSEVEPLEKDIFWLAPNGMELQSHDWKDCQSFGVFLPGDTGLRAPYTNNPVLDNKFIILFNASNKDIEFHIPKFIANNDWKQIFDTSLPDCVVGAGFDSNDRYLIKNHSMAMWDSRQDLTDYDFNESKK